MKLRDLDGQFFGSVDAMTGARHRQGDHLEAAQGVLFQCPACAVGKEVVTDEDGTRGVAGAHYIAICFSNPRGASPAPHEYDHNPRWTMSGTSLDDLSLSPSINLDVPGLTGDQCRWHGFVTNGDAS